CVACRYGLEMPDGLEVAEKTYVDVNIHKEENKSRVESLAQLPDSCAASADKLAEQRAAYEAKGIFSPAMIDSIIKTLRAYNDADNGRKLKKHAELMDEMLSEYYYCGRYDRRYASRALHSTPLHDTPRR